MACLKYESKRFSLKVRYNVHERYAWIHCYNNCTNIIIIINNNITTTIIVNNNKNNNNSVDNG
jgi:hypothetical protein